MSSAYLPALALIGALAGATLAQAQQPPAAPGVMAHRAWDPAQMQARMQAHRAARLRALHDVLAIRPDQESAFAAFAASVRRPEPAPGMRRGEPGMRQGEPGAMAAMTTPERLDRMGQRMQARMAFRQEAFQRRAAATKALYAALGPEQRRTMDALPMLRGGGGRKGHEMGGHGMGGRHMDGQG